MNIIVDDFIEDIAARHGITADQVLDEMFQDYINSGH